MSTEALLALAIGAVLLFWTVGAYNRLVRLREQIAQAWAKVQEALQRRGTAVAPLVVALREPMAGEQGALDTLLVAHTEAARAAGALAAQPLRTELATAWAASESVLAAAAARVLALLEQQDGLRHEEPVAGLLSAWHEGQARLPFARQLFNDASATYNEAVAMFPTRLLARVFGFGPAGRI